MYHSEAQTITTAYAVAETCYEISPVISMVRAALRHTCSNLICYTVGLFLTLGLQAYVPLFIICAPTLFLLVLINAYIQYACVKPSDSSEHINYYSRISQLLWCASFLLIGCTTGPFIGAFMLTVTNGPLLIAVAALATIILTISMFAWTYSLKSVPTQDVRFWNPIVINMVFSVTAAILLNIYCGLPIFQVGIAIGGACLFTIVLLADILQLIIHDTYTNHDNPYRSFLSIQHGANIALDMIHIFEDMLKMMALADSENKPNIILCSIIAVVRFIPTIIVGVCIICMNQEAFKIFMDHGNSERAHDLFNETTPSAPTRSSTSEIKDFDPVPSAPRENVL